MQGGCDHRLELHREHQRPKETPHGPRIIVSYDDTDNDRDALALGRLLAFSGADLSLAYVRHSSGGALEQKEAEELLERGPPRSAPPTCPATSSSTPAPASACGSWPSSENADVIVFGSEYRTADGLVKPGISAHKLLLGGPAAIAVAPAGLRSRPSVSVNTIGVVDEGDEAARATAESLAAALGAGVVRARRARSTCSSSARGRRPPPGKVTISASSDYAVEAATCPVLVVPRGVTIRFDSTAPAPPEQPEQPDSPAVTA